jgi:dihydrodipicolinate synthase/N-acetylneuraminate lyase
VELYDAFRTGDLATARQRQQTLIDAWQIFKYGDIWGAFDEALRWLGICEGATAAPYRTSLSENDRASVRAILEEHVRPSITSHRAGSVSAST